MKDTPTENGYYWATYRCTGCRTLIEVDLTYPCIYHFGTERESFLAQYTDYVGPLKEE